MITFKRCLLAITFSAASIAPVMAQDRPAGVGLQEIPDSELNLMRGRYTVGGNAVAWFGVSMISTWRDASGQRLEGMLTLGMDFRKGGTPTVSFTPSVSITASDAALPDAANRHIDAAGLANVSGLTQSIQVAGDANAARNVLHLNVRDDGVVPVGVGGDGSGTASASVGGASAVAGFDGADARVALTVNGQGSVEQWMRSGSVGQSIQLMADGQQVGNRLQIDLVRQSIGVNAPLVQNVAQAITLARGVGGGLGQ